jgi:hypothetical protein
LEPTNGRLRAALATGKVPVTDAAIDALRTGLATVANGYRIEKAADAAKTTSELGKTLFELHASLRTVVRILTADLAGSGQIDALLSDGLWHRHRLQNYLHSTQSLLIDLDTACVVFSQERAVSTVKKGRRQDLATWFMLAAHDLYSALTEDSDPGIAGPLHRFTQRCAELVSLDIVIPRNEGAFTGRLNAALRRRKTGKITVGPFAVKNTRLPAPNFYGRFRA